MKTIIFVGAHDLMVPLINHLSIQNRVLVYDNGNFTIALDSEVQVIPLPKKCFGLEKLKLGELSLPFYMKGLKNNLKKEQPDLIIVLDFIRFWFWQVLTFAKGKKIKVILYSETQRPPKRLFSKIFFHLFVHKLKKHSSQLCLIASFTDLGTKFNQSLNLKVPLVTLPPDIDTDLFKNINVSEITSHIKLLMNARFVAYKAHPLVLRTLLRARGLGLNISLDFIGRDGDAEQIKALVYKYGLDEHVNFLSTLPRERITDLYQKYDALILPSDGEAIGMVVPEAMACGLPTITSDSVGANVYVLPNETGFIFETNSEDSLLEIFKKLNKKVLNKMGNKARVRIEQFSLGTSAVKLNNLIKL